MSLTFTEILALALGLSMDAAAVSAARGLSLPQLRVSHFLKVALYFGGFQALMPLFGMGLGHLAGPWLQDYGAWLSALIFGALGVKLLKEAWGPSEENELNSRNDYGFRWPEMTLLGLAVSIDAFAAGIGLSLLKASAWVALLSIGLTTAVLSALSLWLGRSLGEHLGRKLEWLGGILLLALSVWVLVSHAH